MKQLARVLPVFLLAASYAFAQTSTATSTAKSFSTDISKELEAVEKKLVSLAEATPPEKFGWRPAEGVRSVSEVYMHVASGNYLFPSILGLKRPEGSVNRDSEKSVTEKTKVIEILRGSFAHMRKAAEAVSDSDLDKNVKFFGADRTERQILLLSLNHAHEHLGQSIAYARMNGITPPWSEGPAPSAADKKPATK